ncbi:unnamed protein product [marine sediment metagenome]|uniref:Uncharacterized protein n=1 Tax=marine sediment metagenome TaxID=412755 RepID=X1F8D9_9ZZZZ
MPLKEKDILWIKLCRICKDLHTGSLTIKVVISKGKPQRLIILNQEIEIVGDEDTARLP